MNCEEAEPSVPNIPGPYVSPEHNESFPLKQALYGGTRKVKRDCCPCVMQDEGSGLRIIITCFFILSLIITIALSAQIYFGDYQLVPHGSVATDSHICSVVGTDILKQGGNAVDAAIASTLCMGVVHPHVTGLGGGGFMLVYNHRKRSVLDVIDFREVAPLNYHGSSSQESVNNGQFIGVPGLVRGLGMAHSLHGKLEWKDVVMPSVFLARKGFQVPQNLIWAWARISANSSNFPKLQEVFGSLEAGENKTFPHLAVALERIAVLGPDVFYNGSLSLSVMQSMVKAGSNVTRIDFSNYTPKRREAMKSKFDKFEVISPGPPSGGPLLLSTLDFFKNVSVTGNVELISILMEKLNEVYETNKGLWGDPDFSIPANENGSAWNFPEAAASHIAAVDLNDLYVSVVSGLNTWFGSQIMTDDEFILNNALKNFDVGNNSGGPGKRPLSLSTPIIVTQSGEVCGRRLVLGAGNAAVAAQLLTELLLLHKNGTSSIEAPRFHLTPLEKQIGFEEGLREPGRSNATLLFLEKSGYKLQKLPKPYESCNVVEKIGDTLISHSDSRGGGVSSRF